MDWQADPGCRIAVPSAAMRSSPGFTLLELLATVAVAAIVLASGVPFVRSLVLDARRTSAVNGLVHGIHLARTEAHRDLRDVVVCRSATGSTCAAAGNWASGWIVFVNEDRDDPPQIDGGERVLHVIQRQSVGSITSNRRAYVLRPYALRATNGTVVFCDERGRPAARAVIVSYTGRPRVSTRNASGQPLTCTA